MDNYGYQNKIIEYIKGKGSDTVFVPSDFATLANRETIKKVLQRLVAEKMIIRLFRGVYYYPRYIELLNEESKPNPNAIADAIARNYGWTIVPSGDIAMNVLGISTQVVASWIYFTDGPYKSYECDGYTIEFKHRTNREITNLSYMSAIVVQALKALGKENLSNEIISKLKAKLTSQDKHKMLQETKFVTDWIYEVIKLICEDER